MVDYYRGMPTVATNSMSILSLNLGHSTICFRCAFDLKCCLFHIKSPINALKNPVVGEHWIDVNMSIPNLQSVHSDLLEEGWYGRITSKLPSVKRNLPIIILESNQLKSSLFL